MKIAVIGAGAMGSIYGGHLSLHNDVYMIDTFRELIMRINREGIILEENGRRNHYHPHASASGEGLPEMDLVILFVKALHSKAALAGNRNIIGKNTYILTLQNGSGHEDILEEFVDREHVIIGTTEDNGAVLGLAQVRHGGEGRTNVGMLAEDKEGFLARLKENFDGCGFKTAIHKNIQQLIWDKLFTNISLSAVTGLLQVPIGFVGENKYAWQLTLALIHEAVGVAHVLHLVADEEAIIASVHAVTEHSPEGITSICADLKEGRRTEVETISGSVVKAAKKLGVAVPSHEFVVNMVHAMEDKAAKDKN